MKKMKKIASVGIAGLAVMAAGGFGSSVAHAENGVQPVTFAIGSGSLTLAQSPSAGTALVEGTPVALPVTTVTDGRNAFDRSGAWTVTATVSDLDEVGGASIPAADITLDQSGSFTSGSGTVGALGLVSASADTIDSVYTYTATAELATQVLPFSGSYTGTVTQTVV